MGTSAPPAEPQDQQEVDTRARSSSGGYPARGSSTVLIHGLERAIAKRRQRAPRHLNPAPSASAVSAGTRENTSPLRPQPAHDPVSYTAGEPRSGACIANSRRAGRGSVM